MSGQLPISVCSTSFFAYMILHRIEATLDMEYGPTKSTKNGFRAGRRMEKYVHDKINFGIFWIKTKNQFTNMDCAP